MLIALRKMRHGPMRRYGAVWRVLGNGYRRWQRFSGWPRRARRRIGPFGPFDLNARFAFSNFDSWGGAHNSAFARCIAACQGATCVLDIGAHIGLVSLPASRAVAPGGRVFAFEPAAGNLVYLRDHVALNGLTNIEVIDCLVGESERTDVAFYEQGGDSGLNSVLGDGKTGRFRKSLHRQVTIDSFCTQRHLTPNVIKIDVEGYELHVLRGAMQTLRAARPLVFLSVHPRQMAQLGSSVEELKETIAALRYEARDPSGRPVEKLEFREYILHPMDNR